VVGSQRLAPALFPLIFACKYGKAPHCCPRSFILIDASYHLVDKDVWVFFADSDWKEAWEGRMAAEW
jgi:hypothetical protein